MTKKAVTNHILVDQLVKTMSDEEDESGLQRKGDDDDDSVLLPAFINKLLKMLADPECTDILQYGADGSTILVVDSSQFATVHPIPVLRFFRE